MVAVSEITMNPLLSARRIVVKVGSSSITGKNVHQIDALVDAIAASHKRGNELILVSSGAIATGLPLLNFDVKPTDLATQQAAAAVGQNVLIGRYQSSFDRHDIVGAQVLLTAGDIDGQTTRANAQRAMERLLSLRVVPIVNENDTVATHEIRFGDNDRLAALVSVLVKADLLVMLSDIDGLYTRPPTEPGAKKIVRVRNDEDLEGVEFGDIGSAGVGTGGAVTKVDAAKYAAQHGVPVLFTATGKLNDIRKVSSGQAHEEAASPEEYHEFVESLGTWFDATADSRPITENVQSIV